MRLEDVHVAMGVDALGAQEFAAVVAASDGLLAVLAARAQAIAD